MTKQDKASVVKALLQLIVNDAADQNKLNEHIKTLEGLLDQWITDDPT